MLRAAGNENNHKNKDGSGYFRDETLEELYLNHVAREGISQIKSLGFSDRSAVSIGGQVILKARPLAKYPRSSVKPYYIKELSTEGNVYNIYNHWQLLRDALNSDHQTSAKSLFGAEEQRRI